MKLKVLAIVLLGVLVVGGIYTASKASVADKYPTKPITLIVPWGAGGSSDLTARAMAPVLEKYLGQPVNVVDKPGANGTIATAEFVRAKGDGYTVLLNAVGNFTIQPFLRPVQYKLDDFKGVIGLSYEPVIIAVNANSPWKTLGDLVEDAKKNNKTITYAHSGNGALPHLSQAALFMHTGINARAVPYQGGGPAITALVGGHVDVAAAHPGEVMPQVEAGTIRPLGIVSEERYENTPNIPTLKEQGYDMGEFAVWKYFLVPASTPDEIVQKLHDAFQKAYNDPAFKDAAEKLKLSILPIDGQEVIKRLHDQAGAFEPVVENLGLKK